LSGTQLKIRKPKVNRIFVYLGASIDAVASNWLEFHGQRSTTSLT